jgi:hypothetical protein
MAGKGAGKYSPLTSLVDVRDQKLRHLILQRRKTKTKKRKEK